MQHTYKARLIPSDVPLVQRPEHKELARGVMRQTYGGRPDMPCPGASLPLYEGGTRWERVYCKTFVLGETGDLLCASCSSIEATARKQLRARKELNEKTTPKRGGSRDNE